MEDALAYSERNTGCNGFSLMCVEIWTHEYRAQRSVGPVGCSGIWVAAGDAEGACDFFSIGTLL